MGKTMSWSWSNSDFKSKTFEFKKVYYFSKKIKKGQNLGPYVAHVQTKIAFTDQHMRPSYGLSHGMPPTGPTCDNIIDI